MVAQAQGDHGKKQRSDAERRVTEKRRAASQAPWVSLLREARLTVLLGTALPPGAAWGGLLRGLPRTTPIGAPRTPVRVPRAQCPVTDSGEVPSQGTAV